MDLPTEFGTRWNQTQDLERSTLQDPKPTPKPTPNGFNKLIIFINFIIS